MLCGVTLGGKYPGYGSVRTLQKTTLKYSIHASRGACAPAVFDKVGLTSSRGVCCLPCYTVYGNHVFKRLRSLTVACYRWRAVQQSPRPFVAVYIRAAENSREENADTEVFPGFPLSLPVSALSRPLSHIPTLSHPYLSSVCKYME